VETESYLSGESTKRYIAPTTSAVELLVVGDFESRHIVLEEQHRRFRKVTKMSRQEEKKCVSCLPTLLPVYTIM